MKSRIGVVPISAKESLPTRECGLKSQELGSIDRLHVTPYAGVWIEIVILCLPQAGFKVTPYAGVWIEISVIMPLFNSAIVTPYAGVWIEILSKIHDWLR